MADISDVENAFVAALTQAAYPNGTGQASAVGHPCRIYRGWPVPANLDADLTNSVVNISVFPMGTEQNLSRYPADWQELPIPATTLTLTVTGQTITFGGAPASPLNAAAIVNGTAFVYAVQPSDTLISIATALAALINAFTPATSSGAVITVPGATYLVARIGRVGTMIQELKRQKKGFRISVWCNNPIVRDTVAGVIDPALAAINYLSMPDGSAARIRYERSDPIDTPEKTMLYRRDFIYSAEYGTTRTTSAAEIVAEITNLTGGLDPTYPAVKSFTI